MSFRKRAINTNKYKDSNTQKNKKIKTMHTCSVVLIFVLAFYRRARRQAQSTRRARSASHARWDFFSRPNPVASDSLRACLVQTDKQTNKQTKRLFCWKVQVVILHPVHAYRASCHGDKQFPLPSQISPFS